MSRNRRAVFRQFLMPFWPRSGIPCVSTRNIPCPQKRQTRRLDSCANPYSVYFFAVNPESVLLHQRARQIFNLHAPQGLPPPLSPLRQSQKHSKLPSRKIRVLDEHNLILKPISSKYGLQHTYV